MPNPTSSTEVDSSIDIADTSKPQLLKTVEGTRPITITFEHKYFQWSKDKSDLTIGFRLVEDTSSKTQFLMGTMICKDLLEYLKPFDTKNGIIPDIQKIANRLNDSLCIELLKIGEPGKTHQFTTALTEDGFCFYRKAGKIRTWVLRLPDVRVNGSRFPCLIRIATCLKDDEHMVISTLMGIPMKEARRRAHK